MALKKCFPKSGEQQLIYFMKNSSSTRMW